ncbi:MAG: hydroxyacid dehydrogenase [Clostridiales bacterium]|nr:hydroxyacid dehydrogenase [Clostridiales bacterium]
MKCIITEKFHESGIELLKEHGTVDVRYNISREDLLNCIDKYDVLIVRSDTPVNKELIDRGKNLKVVGMAGIGLNHIDLEYCKEKGIAVFNVPDGSNDSVAELTIGLLICICRKMYNAINDVKKDHWDKTGYMGNQLKGKTIGLVAIGKIGSRVAKLCQAFGMKVIAYDPFIDPSVATEMNVELMALEDLLKTADIVSMHVPLTPQTYHMIGKEQLDMMKDGAYIINLGRGGLIDEDALYDALVNGKLKGAAVDVMEKEPPGHSKLFELDNFICTPHIGAGTIEAQQYIAESLANKVINHLKSLNA